VLSIPKIYSWFSALLGGASSYIAFVNEYVNPQPGDRILDIGCGPAEIVAHLPTTVEYLGFDVSVKYITAAKKRFGDRATFFCQSVNATSLQNPGTYDIVLAIGVLHHLDDFEAHQLFQIAKAALKPGGKLVTWDGCYVEGQSPIARWLLSRDRGQHVRTPEEYESIAAMTFETIIVSIRHDLLWMPYTYSLMTCKQQIS
jgi:SAM-dependent methyltransferase